MRIFLSIPVPNVVKNIKQMLTSTCENERVEIRWVKHNNLHLTIQFLGSASDDKVTKVRKEVKIHFNEMVFKTVIYRNVKLGEATSFGKSIIDYDVSSRGANNYLNLAKELLLKF